MLYRVYVDVTRARGNQVYEIEAMSEMEARDLYDEGEGTCIHEELEVDDAVIDRIEPVE